jgi:hypothetical protein
MLCREGNASVNLGLRRVLEAIRTFINALEETDRVASTGATLVPVDVHDPNDPLQSRGRVVRRLYLTMSDGAYIHELRERVAMALGHPASYVRMENNRHQYFESMTSEYGLVRSFSCSLGVHVLPHDVGDSTTAGHKDRPDLYERETVLGDDLAVARVKPMAALGNNQSFFDAMLSVVHAGDDDTADVAWDLLSSVPTNVKIKRAVRSLAGTIAPVVSIPGQFFTDAEEQGVLGETSGSAEAMEAAATSAAAIAEPTVRAEDVDWESVLPSSTPEILLYYLSLISRIALAKRGNCGVPRSKPSISKSNAPDRTSVKREVDTVGLPAAEFDAEERREQARALWIKTFLRQGGLSRLLDILVSDKEGASMAMASRLGRHAMQTLLYLVLFFTTKVNSSGFEVGVRPIVPEMPAEEYRAWVSARLEEVNERAAKGDHSAKALARVLKRQLGTESEADSLSAEADPEAMLEDMSLFSDHGAKIDFAALLHRLLRLLREAAEAADAEKRRREEAKARAAESGEGAEETAETADAHVDIMAPSKNASKKKDDPENPKLHQYEDISVESRIAMVALEISVRSCVAQPAALKAMYADPAAVDSILRSLLEASEHAVREATKTQLIALSSYFLGNPEVLPEGVAQPRDWLINALFDNLALVYQHPTTCSQFFQCIASISTLLPPGESLPPPIPRDEDALAKTLAAALKTHPVVEVAPDDSDLILRGLLRVTRALSTLSPRIKTRLGASAADGGLGVVEEVYEQCLFFKPPLDARPDQVLPPKCRSLRSRRAAFALLLGMASGSDENSRALVSRIVQQFTAADAAEEEDDVGGDHAATIAAAAAASASSAGAALGAAGGATSVRLFPVSTLSKVKATNARGQRRFETLYDVKSATGYAGLVNLGCICYMNASNQQLFMIPQFRQGILEHAVKSKAVEDSVTFQVQRMMAHLQETQRRAFNPKPLCMALKDWDGNPINTMEQRDASEYLTQLFDKLETEMAGSAEAKLVKDVVGGVKANEFIAEGGKLYRAREEPFYFLSVTVRHRKSLEDALRHEFSGGEIMEGYRWEDDDTGKDMGRVDVVRRSSIKSAPPHLIVHFKRLDIDVERGIPVKLNDRFEFPRKLNLYPYTVQGRADAVKGVGERRRVVDPSDPATAPPPGSEDDFNPYSNCQGPEDFQYELVGMVIHTGSATAGHYYSYIQERGADGVTGRWFEFNDSYVAEWDPSRMEDDCFGGEDVFQGRGYYDYKYADGQYNRVWVPGREYRRTRYNNAFLAIYDKVKRPTGTVTLSPRLSRTDSEVEAGAAAVAGLGSPQAKAELLRCAKEYAKSVRATQSSSRTAQTEIRAAVPDALLQEIKGEDLALWRKRNTESPDYYKFIRRLLDALSVPEATVAPVKRGTTRMAVQLLDAAEELEREEEDEDALIGDETVDMDSDSVTFQRGPVPPRASDPLMVVEPPVVGYPEGGVSSVAEALHAGGIDVAVARLAMRFAAAAFSSHDPTVRSDAPKWIERLTSLARRNVVVCLWLLQSLVSWQVNLQGVLLAQPDPKLRESLTTLVRIAVRSISRYESLDGAADVEALPKLPPGSVDLPRNIPEAAASALTSSFGKLFHAPDDVSADGTFVAPPGQVLRYLAEALVAEIPRIGRYVQSWAPAFIILRDIAELGGPKAASFLVSRGAVVFAAELIAPGTAGHAVFETLGDFCPREVLEKHESLRMWSQQYLSSSTRRQRPAELTDEEQELVRSKPARTDITPEVDVHVVRCFLSAVVRRMQPVSGLPGSPHGKGEDPAELPAADRITLWSEPFLQVLLHPYADGAQRDQCKALARHVVWGAPLSVNDALASAVRSYHQLAHVDGHLVAGIFWGVENMLDVGDGEASEARNHLLLLSLMDSIKSTRTFYFMTEKSIRMFCKLAAKLPSVMRWVKPEFVEWMPEWLRANPYKPSAHTYYATTADEVRANKPGTRHDVGAYMWRPPGTLEAAEQLAEGEVPFFLDRGYDDDDPSTLVGRRVRINIDSDSDNRYQWLRARCVGFIPERRLHRLVYDWVDGSKSNRVRFEHFRIWALPSDAPLVEGQDPPPPGVEEESGFLGDPDNYRRRGAPPPARQRQPPPAPEDLGLDDTTEPDGDVRDDLGDLPSNEYDDEFDQDMGTYPPRD